MVQSFLQRANISRYNQGGIVMWQTAVWIVLHIKGYQQFNQGKYEYGFYTTQTTILRVCFCLMLQSDYDIAKFALERKQSQLMAKIKETF